MCWRIISSSILELKGQLMPCWIYTSNHFYSKWKSFSIPNRFPCTIVDCKKEYRTQWELNSHYRLKHSKPESIKEHYDDEYIGQGESDSIDFEFGSSSVASTHKIEIQSIEELGSKRKYVLNGEQTEVKKGGSSPKKRYKKNNQQIIYVMPGPTSENVCAGNIYWHLFWWILKDTSDLDLVFEESNYFNVFLPKENLNYKQAIATSSDDDHNYLAPEIDTNIIYIIQPEGTSNGIETFETIPIESTTKPTNILVCNPNFDNMTIMDVGAIQTVDQDAQAIIS